LPGIGFTYSNTFTYRNIFVDAPKQFWEDTSIDNNFSTEASMFKVTFYVYSKILNKECRNVEIHKSMDDARLRALALMWQIESVEEI
jgi:hypothetical protein